MEIESQEVRNYQRESKRISDEIVRRCRVIERLRNSPKNRTQQIKYQQRQIAMLEARLGKRIRKTHEMIFGPTQKKVERLLHRTEELLADCRHYEQHRKRL